MKTKVVDYVREILETNIPEGSELKQHGDMFEIEGPQGIEIVIFSNPFSIRRISYNGSINEEPANKIAKALNTSKGRSFKKDFVAMPTMPI